MNTFINVLHHTFKGKTLITECTDVFMWHCSTSYQQELRQRSGNCLPGYTHWPVEDQPVRARRSALQSVSAAAQRVSNRYSQPEFATVIALDESDPLLVTSASFCVLPQRFPDSGGQGGCV